MRGKIQILPEAIAQTIAAGEVIERPGSVVKELMENAVDAGASEIIVEMKSGGLQLIRVCDNGEGMEPEDVPLAFQRYATSKVKKADDLYLIHTLGFRGEALPSIAAVSQMTLKTRTSQSMIGTKGVCEGGKLGKISEVGCPVGTEVEVKHLFFNIPVKRKFLKSISTELRHSLHPFLRLSLSHPSISFKFLHDGRILHEYLKTESVGVRLEAVLGKEIYSHLEPVEFEDGETRITGFASLPSFSRGNGEGIYLYVNRRFVRDRVIYKAIVEAYRHLLPGGRFPVVILFIDLPPSWVDVNVHPTKAEVKFRDPERIFQAVHGALSSLQGIPSFDRAGGSSLGAEDQSLSKSTSFPLQPSSAHYFLKGEENQDIPVVRDTSSPGWVVERRADFRILGQVQGTYIVCEGEKGLIFIDQHAAHERLLFERYKKEYEGGVIASDRLLIPTVMELSAEESLVLMSYVEVFQSIGFEIDPIGERTYAIRSTPCWINAKDPKELIREMLDDLSFIKRGEKGAEPLHKMLITLACHSAIRGNSLLRNEEMGQLVGSLSPFHPSMTCPHGRPIFFVISLEELAKQFRRKP